MHRALAGPANRRLPEADATYAPVARQRVALAALALPRLSRYRETGAAALEIGLDRAWRRPAPGAGLPDRLRGRRCRRPVHAITGAGRERIAAPASFSAARRRAGRRAGAAPEMADRYLRPAAPAAGPAACRWRRARASCSAARADAGRAAGARFAALPARRGDAAPPAPTASACRATPSASRPRPDGYRIAACRRPRPCTTSTSSCASWPRSARPRRNSPTCCRPGTTWSPATTCCASTHEAHAMAWLALAWLCGAWLLTLVLAAFLTPRAWWRRPNLRALALAVLALGTCSAPVRGAPAVAARRGPPRRGRAASSAGCRHRRCSYRVVDDLNLRAATGVRRAAPAVLPPAPWCSATGAVDGDWWQVSARVEGERSRAGPAACGYAGPTSARALNPAHRVVAQAIPPASARCARSRALRRTAPHDSRR
jgi:hypothetical protein